MAFFQKIIAFFMWILMLLGIVHSTPENPPVDPGTDDPVVVSDADYYVATNGNDSADGSLNSPFATIERAKQAVAETLKDGKTSIKVAIKSGEYKVESLEFTSKDSGSESCPITYSAYGDGDVVINGGVSLDTKDFKPVTDSTMLSRLSEDAKEHVKCIDLSTYGITAEDYGKLYAVGSYNTASKYTGDWTGPIYSEIIINDKRSIMARYPNDGFVKTEKLLEAGETSGKDPKSEVYQISQELTDRVASWKTLDDVWVFGYPKYDWADASSPILSFNAENRSIQPKFTSNFGSKDEVPFYFYNVFEELDSEGEWYLDRENGIAYVYAGDDFDDSKVFISISKKNLIKGTNIENIVFDNLTFTGTREDAISITGNNVTIKNCRIKNVSGLAINIKGYNNLISSNEITATGKGGIKIDGGDRKTLTYGNSKADNNLIHDWSEISRTYQPAIYLYGVGNTASHNEIYNSPHEAIAFQGNLHTIEYNEIHHVCLLTNDGGAIYAGRRWDWYGTVIRYNYIHDIGSEGFKPDGIYMDDALSGETIYGNLLVNIPKNAILLGGGRDLDVKNNIIINAGKRSIYYDERARRYTIEGRANSYGAKTFSIWTNLYSSPYQSDVWKTAFPQINHFSEDLEDLENPDCLVNPSYSTVAGNLVVSPDGKIGSIAESVYRFSTVENNALYKMTDINDIFVSAETGDYTLKENSPVYDILPEFENIPISQIGRY